MKSFLFRLSVFVLVLVLCAGCSSPNKGPDSASLNGIDIADYTIVYDQDEPDYNKRAAEYIQTQIEQRTGIQVPISEAGAGTFAHEIVVGETDRDISARLDAQTQNVEFALLADENHIAMEGDYFVIAAAAYYFVETYIPGQFFDSQIPAEISVHSPIVEEANNVIFLIGDGMGVYQTKLFETMEISDDLDYDLEYCDNEDIFYGYLLPYQGTIRTASLSGTTDSAAGGTALACGQKTYNNFVGKDGDGNDIMSLTELAASMGKATAVLTTDAPTGATPAAFSAHADSRKDTEQILASQAQTTEKYGTIIEGDLVAAMLSDVAITQALSELDKSEKGFFLMYEEAHIDKNCHNSNLEGTFEALIRLNHAIGLFMEYAFYNPDTFLLITADHETGGLSPDPDGQIAYHARGAHTTMDVPIFAYGKGAEVFDGYDQENNEVPKVIAALWGSDAIG